MTTTTAATVTLRAITGSAEAGGGGQDGGGSLLQEVQDRGTLRCGVNDAVPGFGFTGEGGEPEGFDIDFCKVIAAAVLGDAEAVEYTPLSAEQRFTALQSGEIDVLSRNTTYTASRDGTEGARFLHTTFYDGQGMMVRTESGHATLEDLAGETICVLSGTTTELNLESQFQARGIDYTPLAFEDNEPLQAAFVEERCGAWTSDKSQLAGIRSNWPEGQGGPEALTIMDETMSKEPLGPVVERRTTTTGRTRSTGRSTRRSRPRSSGSRPTTSARGARIRRSSASWARRSRASPSTPVSACPTTSRCRW